MATPSDSRSDSGLRRRLPTRVVGVVGTNTEIGKTWVSTRLLSMLRARGLRVAARKPVQSFEPGAGPTDAEQLAAATGERAEDVCPVHRCYPVAMAPPMAADVLRREPILIADLLDEMTWPAHTDIGLVETVGGARSPLAHDADSVELIKRLAVDEVLLIADPGLGAINSVRLTIDCLQPLPATVFLNRYDDAVELHRLNRSWLVEKYGMAVITDLREWC